MLIAVAVISMRIEVAAQAVESAAHDAARAASISRTQAEADAAARQRGQRRTQPTGPHLHSRSDGRAGHEPVPAPDRRAGRRLRSTVTCVVPLNDVGLPGLPGTKTLTATFTSYLDQYRGRS